MRKQNKKHFTQCRTFVPGIYQASVNIPLDKSALGLTNDCSGTLVEIMTPPVYREL